MLAPGTIVADKLAIVRQLGAGGMGAVYEVEHQYTKHRRALKLLHQSCLTPVVIDRFLREASAAGRIGSPHIVEAFDAGLLPSGAPYLVMELLVGRPLSALLLDTGALPIPLAATIVGQAASGVQAAHQAGIVHRDLKPDNLFLVKGPQPFVKILDFGISKFAPDQTNQASLTADSSMLGTPFYMAPEQALGREVDPRTDIYALGVILYQCLGGQVPFGGRTLAELLVNVAQGHYRPLYELRPDLPKDLTEIVSRAMAREPAQRFASARDLMAALAPYGSPSVVLPSVARGHSASAHSAPLGYQTGGALTPPPAYSGGALTPPPGYSGTGGMAASGAAAPPRRRRSRVLGFLLFGCVGVVVLGSLGFGAMVLLGVLTWYSLESTEVVEVGEEPVARRPTRATDSDSSPPEVRDSPEARLARVHDPAHPPPRSGFTPHSACTCRSDVDGDGTVESMQLAWRVDLWERDYVGGRAVSKYILRYYLDIPGREPFYLPTTTERAPPLFSERHWEPVYLTCQKHVVAIAGGSRVTGYDVVRRRVLYTTPLGGDLTPNIEVPEPDEGQFTINCTRPRQPGPVGFIDTNTGEFSFRVLDGQPVQ